MVQKTKKEKAIKLRLEGKSYGEILKLLKIPSKGTLSFWFKDIKLSIEAKERLKKNVEIAYKRGLFAFNKKRTARIDKENKLILSNSIKSIKPISDYELLLIGSMLYWGEGTIRHGRYKYPYLSFSNSNPEIIKTYALFLRRILGAQNERIKGNIHIHDNIKEGAVRKFWAGTTKLPESNFYITRQISRASKFKRDKKFLPYGTLEIKVSPERQLFYQVRGYIDGVVKRLAI
ncbi:MAG: hypothetical protein NTW60_00480 [Candidatus Wolfebacteria bacterium]|nr:hypothetical protein [Candidatus Wolfebacteria bacterium]